MQAALVNAGLPTQDVNTLLTGLQSQLEVNLVNDAMPVQDAIDLARFLVDTTKSFYRFLPGANIVGGETDIAVVTRHEGFKWICRKHHYPASLNLMETDHE